MKNKKKILLGAAFLFGGFLAFTANPQLTVGLILMIMSYVEFRNIDIFKDIINKETTENEV